jgi:hypothetical protein
MHTLMNAEHRPLSRLQRGLAYGLLGWSAEIAFTAAQGALDSRTRSARLMGHSYLWMLPIYGLSAFLFEPLHDVVRSRPAWQRAAAYAAGITAVEYAAGMALRRGIRLVPWDYTGKSRLVIPGGATRLDYVPLWAAAGMLLERVDDQLRSVSMPRRRGAGTETEQ